MFLTISYIDEVGNQYNADGELQYATYALPNIKNENELFTAFGIKPPFYYDTLEEMVLQNILEGKQLEKEETLSRIKKKLDSQATIVENAKLAIIPVETMDFYVDQQKQFEDDLLSASDEEFLRIVDEGKEDCSFEEDKTIEDKITALGMR